MKKTFRETSRQLSKLKTSVCIFMLYDVRIYIYNIYIYIYLCVCIHNYTILYVRLLLKNQMHLAALHASKAS